MSTARLKLSNHAKERLFERYKFKSDPELINKLSKKGRYKLITVNKKGEQIREVQHNGVKIQAVIARTVVAYDVVKSFIPNTFAKVNIENKDLQPKDVTELVFYDNQKLSSQVQGLNMKMKDKNKKLFNSGFWSGLKYWYNGYKKANKGVK